MQLGMVGLGRMGANMTRRLMRGGHTMVVSDLSADAVKGIAGEGAVASSSLDDLISKLNAPRAAWMRRHPTHSGTRQTRWDCRKRLHPLRSVRLRTFRQDGPQRH